jgi:serine/threonine protein kinase
VLDEAGYPNVVDFGFAKPTTLHQRNDDPDDNSVSQRHTTLCGSLAYMSPEMVSHETHDCRTDIWSFGIVLYELCTGTTPFVETNAREHMRQIQNAPLHFPHDIFWAGTKVDSEDGHDTDRLDPVRHHHHHHHRNHQRHAHRPTNAAMYADIAALITTCLQKRPSQRISTMAQIKQHAFFQGMDWAALGRREITAPYRPDELNHLDHCRALDAMYADGDTHVHQADMNHDLKTMYHQDHAWAKDF